MPSVDALCKNVYTAGDWLNYYWNLWTRNLAARTIDVETDIELKAEDPEQLVDMDTGVQAPVKVRLEHRKILVQDALKLLRAIEKLQALGDELPKVWSDEALAVAQDMLEPETPAQPAPAAEQPATEPAAETPATPAEAAPAAEPAAPINE